LLRHLPGQVEAQILIEPAQEERSAIDLGGLGPQAGENAGKFDSNVAATHDQEAFRLLFQEEDIVGDDPELLPLVIGAAGDAACSDQYVLSAHPLPADLDGVRASQPSPALDNLHAGIGEQAFIDAIKTGNLGVLVLDQRLPVEMALSKAPAIAGRMFEFLSEGTGIDHQLLRHAADVDAGSPQMALFSHRD